jgi:L-ascorbate metabolism protein UlaG (beta-lactamase superfamily)
MKIKYLAHASFLITSQDNTRIITDPYTVGQGISYGAINEPADIVTVTHSHGDHSNSKSVKGNPVIIQEPGAQTVKGIKIKGTPVFHDEAQGSKRGKNTMFCFEIDGMNLCHVGDLGHQLSPSQISEIGKVDILLIPVGGFFTIDSSGASAVVKSIQPRVVIPMHYKTPKAEYPIAPVDDFLKDKKNVKRSVSSEAEFTRATLPKDTEILVLSPAL